VKSYCNTTSISALLLSLCLITVVPESLKSALTWREPYTVMPLGLYSLGFVMIGLIVLWTGYRKRERLAWFVMLIILFFYIFPSGFLPLLLQNTIEPEIFGPNLSTIDLSSEIKWILEGNRMAIGLMMELLVFPVMLIALLLPIKAFFWKSANSKTVE
jgi:hypothetical protein